MSAVEKTSRWFERGGDWLNSILVKETRQALKSRQFVATFMLLLIAAWLVSVFGLLLAGNDLEYGSAGSQFFYFYFVCLMVAILIVVPFGSFRSLLSERDENTYELLSITSLKPRQIVWGKLLSALLQAFIYYSAIAPFIAFTSLLQGFDFAQVVYLLVILLFAALGLSMAALMLSTMVKQRHWQAIMSLAVLGGLLMAFFFFFAIAGQLSMVNVGFDDPDFWWGNGFIVAGGLSYILLFQQITTTQLTFEADNRATGIRAICSLQFWLIWAALGVYCWWDGSRPDEEAIIFLTTLSVLHWSAAGLFFVTEPDYLSRRVRRDLPKNRFVRLLYAPLLPGGSRGLLFVLFHLACLAALSVTLLSQSASRVSARVMTTTAMPVSTATPVVTGPGGRVIMTPPGAPVPVVTPTPPAGVPGLAWKSIFLVVTCCYPVIYLGIASLFGRVGRRMTPDLHSAHIRILSFLFFMAGLIAPYIPKLLSPRNFQGYWLLEVTNPASTMLELERSCRPGNHVSLMATQVMIILGLAATTVILLNLRAILRSINEVVSANFQPRTAAAPAPPLPAEGALTTAT